MLSDDPKKSVDFMKNHQLVSHTSRWTEQVNQLLSLQMLILMFPVTAATKSVIMNNKDIMMLQYKELYT